MGEDQMWRIAGCINERISHSKTKFDGVTIGDSSAVRAIRRLSGLQRPTMRR